MDNDKKKDFFKSKAFILLLFLLGIMVALYPSIAQWYYKIEANEETENFEETINTIDKKELEKK